MIKRRWHSLDSLVRKSKVILHFNFTYHTKIIKGEILMKGNTLIADAVKGIGITIKDAIESRRSIRKFLPDDIPDDIIMELIRAAQLAPSGCNAQPWRFKIIKDQEIKKQLADATFNHPFILEAPVVLVCCGDVMNFKSDTLSGLQYLKEIGVVNLEAVDITDKYIKNVPMGSPLIWVNLVLNVAIAIEHIVLRALDFNIGTCWIGGFYPDKVKQILGLDDKFFIVAMLPIGYPAESPKPRKRLPLEDILF
jgi:nitroreductase